MICEDGRTLLREVLSGPPVFTPEGKGYHFQNVLPSAVHGG
jgi:hypothetical protein